MTDRLHHLTTSRASQAWNVLAGHVDALSEAWETDGEPPDLAAFLPEDPPELRKLVLVELIKVDLELRWQTDAQRKQIEDYAREFPELATCGVPCDLIFEEYHIRRRADDSVTPDEYLERFPDQADELRRLLHLDTSAASTTLAGRRRLPKIEVGDEVEDFDLLASLGQGAFGKVFLARQRSMQRLVALKISGDHGEEPQTLAQLDHPHIVRVYDQRKLTDRKLRLLYMQYVPGGTLQQVVRMRRNRWGEKLTGRDLLCVVDSALDARGIAPPVQSVSRTWLATAPWWQVVAWLGVRMAKGLDSAHARGVLHRDVKPANVLLDADGEPKLADFNISYCNKLDGASADAFFGGSLPYMSPEQLEVCCPRYSRTADQIDARSDLYSLGVVLWELLTGLLPHGEEAVRGAWSETLVEFLRRRRTPVDADKTALQLDVAARPLVRVLASCLAPNPEDRPQSGGELSRQLALCLTPEVQALLSIEPDSWRHWALAHPYLSIVTAGLAPNILSGYFNYQYNEGAIVRHLDDQSQKLFANISIAINGVAFPLGAVIGIWLLRRLAQGLARRDELPSEAKQSLRGFALMFGLYVALVGTVEWLSAGPIFPLSFHLLGGHVPPSGWLHFFASMSISGLIAASYPYLLITLLGTRVYFPALLGTDAIEATDDKLLTRTAILSQAALVLTAAIPMLGVTLAAFSGAAERMVLGTMSLVTTLGFLFAFWLYFNIQRDVRRLREIVD